MAEDANAPEANKDQLSHGASAEFDPKLRPVKSRLVEYFVTVGVGDSIIPIEDYGMTNPIREFRIIGGKEATPPHFEKIAITAGGRNACFLKKGYFGFGNGYYLCYSRTVAKVPISQMVLAVSAKPAKEWERVNQALPKGDDKTFYLDYARQTQYPPLCDICMVNDRMGEEVPQGYDKLEPSIGDFFICIRRAPETILGLRFQSHVLMRFPEEDYVDNPLNTNVAIFCQPEGAQLKQSPPMQSSLSFILTDQEGKMMYASAITFYEKMTNEQIEPFRDALLSPCSVVIESAGEKSVNGTYLPDGSHDGVPMFCKRISDSQEMVEDVVLFRQKSVENHQRYWWLIGRELSPTNGALVGQRDLYCVQSSEDRPPAQGWMRLESAKSPIPKVTVVKDEGAVQSGYIPSWPKQKGPMYQPKTICILSRQPFFDTFRSALTDIYRISMSKGNTPLERYIVNICQEIPVPIAGRYQVSLKLAHQPIIFRKPKENSLPLLDANLSIIFRSLDVDGVIKIWQALLLEQKVVVFSSNLSLITATFEGFCSLLLPFKWQFTYVPVLPYVMIGIEDAPMPVFVGMHKSRLTSEFYDENRSIVMVDLDAGFVNVPKTLKLPELPSSLHKQLINDLRVYGGVETLPKFDPAQLETVDCPYLANGILAYEDTMFDPIIVRTCFLKLFIHLFTPRVEKPKIKTKSLTDYLLYPQHLMDDNLFNKKAFLSDSNRSYRKFLSAIMGTDNTTFMRFCEDLTYTPVHDPVRVRELTFFRNCCEIERKHIEDPSANDSILTAIQNSDEVLETVHVMEVNRTGLPDGYTYEAESGFCELNPEFFSEPREPELPKAASALPPLKVEDKYPEAMDQRGRAVSRQPTKNANPEEDDANQALLAVYGCWFALQAAVIECHSDPNLTVEEMLETLNNLREGGEIIPDEQIYKACLIVCGKFRHQEEAKQIFADMKASGIHPSSSTYGAYTNSLASSVKLSTTPLGGTFNFDEYLSRRRNSSESPKPKSKRARSLVLKRDDKISKKRAPHSHDSKLRKIPSNSEQELPEVVSPRFKKQHSEPPLRISSISSLISDELGGEAIPVRITDDPGDINSDNTYTEPLAKGSPQRLSNPLLNTSAKSSNSLEVIPVMDKMVRKHSLDLPDNSPMRKRSSSAPRYGRGRSHSPHNLSSAASDATEEEFDPIKVHWQSVKIDTTCICERCGALLGDAHIMAGWDINSFSTRTSRCVYCQTEFTPWMRVEYLYSMQSEDDDVDGMDEVEVAVKSQRVQNEYLSPIVLRRELTKALNVSKYEFMSLKKFRENHATIFWNLLWYIFLTGNISADSLIGKMPLTLRFQFFDCPRRCIYPLDSEVLKVAVRAIIFALKKEDINKAIELWEKYRSEEPEEHLMRFKSLWEHPIISGLEVINKAIGKSRPYKTKSKFRQAFSDACKLLSELSEKDHIIPTRVATFETAFKIPNLHIPRLADAAKDAADS